MARTVRKAARTARTRDVPLAEVKDDLSRYLKEAADVARFIDFLDQQPKDQR